MGVERIVKKMGRTDRVKYRLGTICIIIGSLLVAAAIGLFIRNIMQAQAAEESANAALMAVKSAISERLSDAGKEQEAGEGTKVLQNMEKTVAESDVKKADIKEANVSETDIKEADVEEAHVNETDVSEYLGYVCIPALELELPVMSEWSYPKLKLAPCRYYGSAETGNLVIAAHNYPRHFGMLSKLELGNEVKFIDMEGKEWSYEVTAVDVLSPENVEEMTAAGYGLTLFTCTYGGANRITIRCD